MDKYDTSHDPYCYQNSTTLKNRLGIQSLDMLEKAERDITSKTLESIKYDAPPYDLAYLQKLHRQLFYPLYDWAGEIRTIDISKGGTFFCTNLRIIAQSELLFKQLKNENWLKNLDIKTFCEKLAEYYCEFNMIHPFREGNGRVQRLFFEHLSLSAGYELNWENVDALEWVQANIDGVLVNYHPMIKIFLKVVKNNLIET